MERAEPKLTEIQRAVIDLLDKGIPQSQVAARLGKQCCYVNKIAKWRKGGFQGRPTSLSWSEYSRQTKAVAGALNAQGRPFTCLRCGREYGDKYSRICDSCRGINGRVHCWQEGGRICT